MREQGEPVQHEGVGQRDRRGDEERPGDTAPARPAPARTNNPPRRGSDLRAGDTEVASARTATARASVASSSTAGGSVHRLVRQPRQEIRRRRRSTAQGGQPRPDTQDRRAPLKMTKLEPLDARASRSSTCPAGSGTEEDRPHRAQHVERRDERAEDARDRATTGARSSTRPGRRGTRRRSRRGPEARASSSPRSRRTPRSRACDARSRPSPSCP